MIRTPVSRYYLPRIIVREDRSPVTPTPPAVGGVPGVATLSRRGAASYSVWLTNQLGERLLLLNRILRINYTLPVSGVGFCSVDLPPKFDIDNFIRDDYRLEIWRRLPGGLTYLDNNQVWFIRDYDLILNQQGLEVFRLTGFSNNWILDGARIPYQDETSQAVKTDEIDDLMKALVKDNQGEDATDSDRDLSQYMTVDSDKSLGDSITKTMPWRHMLSVLKELSDESIERGNPIYFGLVYDPSSRVFSFITKQGQWGVDHSVKDNGLVVLSARNGTLRKVKRSHRSSDERNYVYVLGEGPPNNREVYEQANIPRSGVSPFNRREITIEARNASTSELATEAEAALNRYSVQELFDAQLRDSRAFRYGEHFGLGDKVLGEHRARVETVYIDVIEVKLENGYETIEASLRT